MAQTFGQRILPPAEELPGQVRDRLTALAGARQHAGEVHAALGAARRVELAEARQQDIEARADAIEAGRAAPKSTHEQKAVAKIASLEREAEAAALVEARCMARLDEAITEQRDRIAHVAEKKLAAAKKDFLAGVDALEGTLQRLAAANALAAWAEDPSTSYKQRGGPALHAIPGPSGDPLTAAEAIAGLRQAFTPRPAHRIPSPFAVPVSPSPPDGPTPAEAQPEHSFAAELAAGSSPAGA